MVNFSVDGRHVFRVPYLLYIAMINPRNKKSVRKPRNVFINPDVLRGAHVEALH